MQKLQSWVNTHVSTFNDKPIGLMSTLFFREEMRTQLNDDRVFMSVADGIVIGISRTTIDSDESVVNAKGVDYSLKQMVNNDEDVVSYLKKHSKECLVIDVFMTYYDVHNNTVPYNCIQLDFKQLKPLRTMNSPMIKTEEELFKGNLGEALKYTSKYLVNNQRAITTFYNADLNKKFFTVQLGDDVVDTIVNYQEHKDTKLLLAGQKFGQIRMGSGCSLIIPITDDFDVEEIVKIGDHIEGGVDAVAKITKLNGNTVNDDISFDYNSEITDETYYDKTEDLDNDESFNDLNSDN